MLESELFELLEHTADAAYTVTTAGEICSWNRAAERLFGYPASAAIGRNSGDLLDARDALGTRALGGGPDAVTRQRDAETGAVPNFDLDVRTAAGDRLWINVSTIVFTNERLGRRLFARLAQDISQRYRNAELFSRMLDVARQVVALAGDASHHAGVEPLSEQERRILSLFARGRDAAAITRKLGISPHTLRNHLHRINRKLRTRSRLEAVTHAQRRGLLD